MLGRLYWMFLTIVILFGSASLALSEETDKAIWPAPSSVQKYWYLPKADFSIEQINAAFNDAALSKISFNDPNYPSAICNIKKMQLKLSKHPKASDSDVIRINSDWIGLNNAFGKDGSAKCSWKLADIQAIGLAYNSSGTNQKWMLVVTVERSQWFFWFQEETQARRFGDAIASAIVKKGLGLSFPILGMSVGDLTPEQAQNIGITRIENALVASVLIDGPADKAGIQTLDIITEINGTKIRNASHFYSLMSEVSSETPLAIACLRREEKMENGKEIVLYKTKTFNLPHQ